MTPQRQAGYALAILGVNVLDRKKETKDSCWEKEIVGVYCFSGVVYNERWTLNIHLCKSCLF